jgi:hypothetical protein
MFDRRQATGDGTNANFSPSALVRHHRYRQALDDRDKIFAIVGLRWIPELGSQWVDHDRSVASIYTSFVRRRIRHETTLDILHGCCIARVPWEYNLPSWATDWTEK